MAEKTHLEALIHRFAGEEKPDPREFFLAWNIAPPIIAERLRLAGFPADAAEIASILDNGIKTRTQLYQLSVVMMEMRNDITKTLYPK